MTVRVNTLGFNVGDVVVLSDAFSQRQQLIINGFSATFFNRTDEAGGWNITLANCVCCTADGCITNVDINVELLEPTGGDVEAIESYVPDPVPDY